MNYSIMSQEVLAKETTTEALSNRLECQLEGKIMEVDIDSGKLLRIISSDPNDYLLYQPGLKVSFKPQLE